ncbi:hypothetical protein BH11ARM1_BH11ARM1_06890 [soil metagenome]
MLLALLLSSFVPNIQAKTLTVSVEVERLDLAAAKLSKATGLVIRAEEPAASEIVFLNVKNLPVKAVLDNLATATASTLSRDPLGGGYVFSRSASKTASFVQLEETRKLNRLRAWRARLVKGLSISYGPMPLARTLKERARAGREMDSDGSEEHLQNARLLYESLTFSDPAYRALARCIKDLDLRQVAGLHTQASLVYTAKPLPSQHQLPAESVVAMEKLLPEQLIFGKTLRAVPMEEGETKDSRFTSDQSATFFKESDGGFASRVEPFERTLPYSKRPLSTILTVSCYSEGAYRMDLHMYDSHGAAVMSFDCDNISTSDYEYVPTEANPPKINPSAETLALWKRAEGSGQSVIPSINELERFFDDPVKNDWLWIGNQESLTALANRSGKSVIACLTDQCVQSWSSELSMKFEELTRHDSSGVIRLMPKSFTKNWIKRVDRHSMAEFIRQERAGSPDLLTFVRMTAHCGDSPDRTYGAVFAQLANPDFRQSRGSYELPFQTGFQELAATLSKMQLVRIGRGETIRYSELSPPQLGIARRIVYGIRVNVSVNGESDFEFDEHGATMELPNGILTGTGISGKIGNDRILLFHNDEAPPDDEFYRVNLEKDNNGFYWSGPGPRLPKGGIANATYTVNPQQILELRCGLKGTHCVVGRIAAPVGKPLSKAVLFTELPKEIQDNAAVTVKALGQMRGR